MNFAQFIDREKMKGQDPLALRPAPRPPMGVVTHEGNISRRARQSETDGFGSRAHIKAPPP